MQKLQRLLLASMLIGLASCSAWTGEEDLANSGGETAARGGVTVSIGASDSNARAASISYSSNGNSRAAWGDDETLLWDNTVFLNQIKHYVTLSGDLGETREGEIDPGGGTLQWKGVEPGLWEITVLGYLPDESNAAVRGQLVSVSEYTTVDVKPTGTTPAPVKMQEPPAGPVTVSFDLNGGSGTVPPPKNGVVVGDSITLPLGTGLTRAGHGFGGWSPSSSGTPSYEAGDSYQVTEGITLYAKWTPYTVTFSANNASSGTPPDPVTANAAGTVTLPDNTGNLARIGYSFEGWNTSPLGDGPPRAVGVTYTPTGNETLYAHWNPASTTIGNLEKLTGTIWNPVSGVTDLASVITIVNATPGTYRLNVTAAHTLAAPQTALSGTTLDLTIVGVTGERVIELSAGGSLFTVQNGAKLTLDDKITLKGYASNQTVLVKITEDGSELIMNTGSKITGNKNIIQGYGSGVAVEDGAVFTMNDGEISGNYITQYGWGSGVYVSGSDSRFYMYDGKITGNHIETGYSDGALGGGVFVSGTFIMYDGEISGNTIAAGYNGILGGGVCVFGGTFNMYDGTITGNRAIQSGTEGNGGGVYVGNGGTFNMANNTPVISENVATNGGGVYVADGSFTMMAGEIRGHTLTDSFNGEKGGGVYVDNTGTFLKTGTASEIFGSDGGANRNNANATGAGHAVFVQGNPAETPPVPDRYRDLGAPGGVNLNAAPGNTNNWNQ